ncbi:unnamed protein product [Mytilus edulis]|uniref:Fibrinogen C-terminal domain-containing protein n=1 Tax=Mytilus edulis TaxID=6550 RepID=A0A8S3PWR9_MYTED|nr:unnamed protein product [Mytilus edulis]
MSGTCTFIGNGLSIHNGQAFTTKDKDNDPWTYRPYKANCAIYSQGGWWYKNCAYSNLNGVYMEGGKRKAMDIVSEPNEEHQEVQETNKGRQLENDHIVTETGDTYFTTETNDIAHLEVMQKNLDPMEGASPYYKDLYKRRFVNDVNDKENAIPIMWYECQFNSNMREFRDN